MSGFLSIAPSLEEFLVRGSIKGQAKTFSIRSLYAKIRLKSQPHSKLRTWSLRDLWARGQPIKGKIRSREDLGRLRASNLVIIGT
jgi:hypothetical protein